MILSFYMRLFFVKNLTVSITTIHFLLFLFEWNNN